MSDSDPLNQKMNPEIDTVDKTAEVSRYIKARSVYVAGILLILLLTMLAAAYVFFVVRGEGSRQEPVNSTSVITLYNWDAYTDLSVLEDFERETGIKVLLKEYGQAFEMFSVVESDPSQYDVIITDDHSVESLLKAKLIARLDLDKLPNFQNIKDEFKDLYFDRGNNYSVPYLYGTTGLGVNTNFVKNNLESWNFLYDPKYKGKFALLDDPREFMTAVLKSLHYSSNTTDKNKLEDAEERAKLIKENGATLSDSYPLQQKLIDGELWVVMAYSGDLLQQIEDHPEIVYVIPKEGSNKWVDNYVISSGSKNVEAAHAFLNFVMRPDIAARISNKLLYASPNRSAEALISPEILSNPIIYPGPDQLMNLEFLEGVGEAESEYNRIYSLMN